MKGQNLEHDWRKVPRVLKLGKESQKKMAQHVNCEVGRGIDERRTNQLETVKDAVRGNQRVDQELGPDTASAAAAGQGAEQMSAFRTAAGRGVLW